MLPLHLTLHPHASPPPADHRDPGVQEAEEDGHRRSLRSLRQDQAARQQGQADREEEEDHDQKRQPEPLLQRVFRVRGGRKPAEQGGPKY